MKITPLKILVFPCGSEIGLEIHRSLKYSRHIHLYGASSIDDHGKYIYKNYISNVPFYSDKNFISRIKEIVEKYKIDAIYPAMDSVITKLSMAEKEIGCKVIASPIETNSICLSKKETYKKLSNVVKTPKVYESTKDISSFPVFQKPIIGYGSRGVKKINLESELTNFNFTDSNFIITEYLPGEEFTVDCFTNSNNELLFVGPRKRNRVMNGISVNTTIASDINHNFYEFATRINNTLNMKGAWFFQVKKNENGELTLLEVASRMAGSSSLYRNIGVNFALLSIFDAFGYDVDIFTNRYNISLDRALDNKYKLDISYEVAYIDFDDCLILNKKIVNTDLIRLIYQMINKNIKVYLLTKHLKDINDSLKKFRLSNLFDKVIKISPSDEKSNFIEHKNSIFIDDSHLERKKVWESLQIPVFAPDNIEVLLD